MSEQRKETERGAITLEACVSVTLFMAFMLFFIGLFAMFHAQQTIAHAMVQSSQSLAFETYGTEKLEFEVGGKSGLGVAITEAITAIYDFASDSSESFSNDSRWYDEADCSEAVKERFVGYFSGGDEALAEKYLASLHVVDGLDGLDFSESKVEGGVLYVVVKYKLEYMFKLGDFGVIEAEQCFSANLWGV